MADSTLLTSLTPTTLIRLMQETGLVIVDENVVAEGKPVIHAALTKRNAVTGELLPDGLAFSVVMHRGKADKAYTSLSLGAVVPLAELGFTVPPNFFHFSNQRLRFVRVYPLDAKSFVIQMDILVANATREYVKFAFGLWGSLYAQIVFELVGQARDGLAVAAEAYAAAHQPQPAPALAANDVEVVVQEDAAPSWDNVLVLSSVIGAVDQNPLPPAEDAEPEIAPEPVAQLPAVSLEPDIPADFDGNGLAAMQEEEAAVQHAAASGEPPRDLK